MRLIVASLIVFSIIILFLFALFPSDISVTRVVQIRTSPEKLRKKLTDLREWKSWNEMLDNALANRFTDPGIIDSARIKKGSLEVFLVSVSPDTVIAKWQYERKSFTGNYNLTEMNGQIILEWTLHFHINWYPWEKLSSMFYDKELGPIMEASMIKLQRELEKN